MEIAVREIGTVGRVDHLHSSRNQSHVRLAVWNLAMLCKMTKAWHSNLCLLGWMACRNSQVYYSNARQLRCHLRQGNPQEASLRRPKIQLPWPSLPNALLSLSLLWDMVGVSKQGNLAPLTHVSSRVTTHCRNYSPWSAYRVKCMTESHTTNLVFIWGSLARSVHMPFRNPNGCEQC